MLLKNRRDTRKRVTIISNVRWPEPHDNSPEHEGSDKEPQFEPWHDCGDVLMRMIYVPSVWLKPGQAIPNCSGCGTPFKKKSEYTNMISYEANCLDLHDHE